LGIFNFWAEESLSSSDRPALGLDGYPGIGFFGFRGAPGEIDEPLKRLTGQAGALCAPRLSHRYAVLGSNSRPRGS